MEENKKSFEFKVYRSEFKNIEKDNVVINNDKARILLKNINLEFSCAICDYDTITRIEGIYCKINRLYLSTNSKTRYDILANNLKEIKKVDIQSFKFESEKTEGNIRSYDTEFEIGERPVCYIEAISEKDEVSEYKFFINKMSIFMDNNTKNYKSNMRVFRNIIAIREKLAATDWQSKTEKISYLLDYKDYYNVYEKVIPNYFSDIDKKEFEDIIYSLTKNKKSVYENNDEKYVNFFSLCKVYLTRIKKCDIKKLEEEWNAEESKLKKEAEKKAEEEKKKKKENNFKERYKNGASQNYELTDEEEREMKNSCEDLLKKIGNVVSNFIGIIKTKYFSNILSSNCSEDEKSLLYIFLNNREKEWKSGWYGEYFSYSGSFDFYQIMEEIEDNYDYDDYEEMYLFLKEAYSNFKNANKELDYYYEKKNGTTEAKKEKREEYRTLQNYYLDEDYDYLKNYEIIEPEIKICGVDNETWKKLKECKGVINTVCVDINQELHISNKNIWIAKKFNEIIYKNKSFKNIEDFKEFLKNDLNGSSVSSNDSKLKLIGKKFKDSIVIDYDDNGIVVRDSNGYERYIKDTSEFVYTINNIDYGYEKNFRLIFDNEKDAKEQLEFLKEIGSMHGYVHKEPREWFSEKEIEEQKELYVKSTWERDIENFPYEEENDFYNRHQYDSVKRNQDIETLVCRKEELEDELNYLTYEIETSGGNTDFKTEKRLESLSEEIKELERVIKELEG